MSLIQEALKRQQMEQEGKLPLGGDAKAASPLQSTVVDGETFILPGAMPESAAPEVPAKPAKPALKRNARPAPEPVAPPPVPPAEEPERKRVSPTPSGEDSADGKKTRVLPALATMVIVLLLLAGALAWAVTYGLERAGVRMPWSRTEPVVAEQPGAEPPADPAPASAAGTAEVQVAGTPAVKPADAPASAAAATPVKKPTIGSVVREAVKGANTATADANVVIADAAGDKPAAPETPAKAAPAKAPAPAVTAAVAGTPAVAAVKAPEAIAPLPPVSIKWPDITITGVVGKEQKGAVFVNGKVVGVNETVEDIRIIAIKPQGALLEYQGETRLAKVGQPLNRAPAPR